MSQKGGSASHLIFRDGHIPKNKDERKFILDV